MNDTAVKPKWTKKKKILVIVLSIVAFLLIAIIGGGLYALNWYCTPVEYEVVSASEISDKNTKIIGHRGFRAVAPENTLPSFQKAGENNFWGAECDIYRTKDGVWVVQHDVNTYRMMDITKSIEKCTYEELLQHFTDNGNYIEDYPDLRICSFEEYLMTCEKYNMTAIIELKGKHNTEHYDEIMDALSKYNVEYSFISFHEENLYALRELTDAPLFFLVQKIDDKAIETAKSIGNCGIDFNGNKKKNYDDDSAIIKKCQDEGIVLGAWTINDLGTMQKLLNLGVDYITTDCITY